MSVHMYYYSFCTNVQMLPLYPIFLSSIIVCHMRTRAFTGFLEYLSPYGSPCKGTPGTWTFSENWTFWGVLQNKTVSYKNWDAYNLGTHSTLFIHICITRKLQNTGRVGFLNLPGGIFWLDSPRWSYRHPLGLIYLKKLFCGHADAPTSW